MASQGYMMVRYADDGVVLCQSKEQARTALVELQAWTTAHLLKLHPEKTKLVDMNSIGGMDFLGYHFEKSRREKEKTVI